MSSCQTKLILKSKSEENLKIDFNFDEILYKNCLKLLENKLKNTVVKDILINTIVNDHFSNNQNNYNKNLH